MISLDSRLKGAVLCIRPSQDKFPSNSTDLGICGAAKKALPFYLNRPLIKVLEDLGVEVEAFMTLQQDEVSRLRATADSSINVASFLERNDIGKPLSLPWLFENLFFMGIPALEDHFLWAAVEVAIITRLRTLKHRSRIPVEHGVTLYGIMDETNTLREGEIYCSTPDRQPIRGHVTITRPPVMHPGDVQRVNSVDVDKDSPLKRLHNCVVFSQRGSRDLPSCLSGGDLDGDYYNIIYDPRLQPKTIYEPADYPRVAAPGIGREVTVDDMIEFLITFMSNDQLGRIATTHLQVVSQTLFVTCVFRANTI